MKHPYIGLPDRQFWKRDAGIADGSHLDPVSEVPFRITRSDRVVTAGSCFAQHVARYLTASGFNHHIVERAHVGIPEELAARHNYGVFAARYGNLYTARQLRQLVDRAYGRFTPQQIAWSAQQDGRFVDPFRPQIQPRGYTSEQEVLADQAQHLKCVCAGLEQMDVFVFTLGLTEAWVDTRDEAVFPVAPGVVGGVYEPDRVAFRNFDETETWDDLHAALSAIRALNPDVKIVLTVSPVPLNATYEDRHVLVSTTWSKAVLRIVAEKAARHFADCCYFPSYEIITGPHARGRYFAADCREVTQAGVDHVMGLFMEHFADVQSEGPGPTANDEMKTIAAQHEQRMQAQADILCDEASIDNR